MFEIYQTEIIIAGILFLSAIIYIIIKSTNKKKSVDFKAHHEDNSQKVSALVVDEYDDKGGVFHNQQHSEQLDKTKHVEKRKVAQHKLPLRELKFHKRDVPPHDKITKENFKEFAGARILLAEDNLINQKVIKGLVANTGIEIIVANDGKEALDILENDTDFLMILMDAHMPNLDGFQATKIIRQNSDYDHILIVALSGDVAPDDIKKMKESGMSEQLAKPLKIADFYDILYAYSGKLKPTLPPSILNIEKGLEICSGDRDFYKDILNEFLSLYQDSADVLSNYLDNKQLNAANILLLDIIGVATNIGADSLKKTAIAIKTELANNNKDVIPLKESYKKELEALISAIQSY